MDCPVICWLLSSHVQALEACARALLVQAHIVPFKRTQLLRMQCCAAPPSPPLMLGAQGIPGGFQTFVPQAEDEPATLKVSTAAACLLTLA